MTMTPSWFWRSSERTVPTPPVVNFNSKRAQDLSGELDKLTRSFRVTSKAQAESVEKKVAAQAVRDRVAEVRARNKPRRILVVEYDTNQSVMAAALAKANPAATVQQAKNLTDAYRLAKTGKFEMVYLVAGLIQGGSSCRGPCFFSASHPDQEHLRVQAASAVVRLRKVLHHLESGGAEVMVVCGSDHRRCPLSNELYSAAKTSFFDV